MIRSGKAPLSGKEAGTACRQWLIADVCMNHASLTRMMKSFLLVRHANGLYDM